MAKKSTKFRPNCVIVVTDEERVGEFRLRQRVTLSRDLAMRVQDGEYQTNYFLEDDMGRDPSWFSVQQFPGMTPSSRNEVPRGALVEIVPGTEVRYTYETQGYLDGVETPYDGTLFCEAFQRYVDEHAIPLVRIECRTPSQARTGVGLDRAGGEPRLRVGETPSDVLDLVQQARAHASRHVRNAG